MIAVGAAVGLATALLFITMGSGWWNGLKGLLAGPPVAVALARLSCPFVIVDPSLSIPAGTNANERAKSGKRKERR